jgi:hypothetical protein
MSLRIDKEKSDCTIEELVYFLQCMREQYGNILVDSQGECGGECLSSATVVAENNVVYLRLQ